MVGTVQKISMGPRRWHYRAELVLPVEEVKIQAESDNGGYLAACKIVLMLKRLGYTDEIKFYDVDRDIFYTYESDEDYGI